MRGAIIGDIMGSPYEGSGQQKVYDIRLWTEDSHPTDDSALTIATAEAIMTGKPYEEMYHKYWFDYPWAGYGTMFCEWGTRYPSMGPYNSYGNGSAMRVSPIAWAFSDLKTIQKEAEKSAACTHNHPEGIKGAVSVATLIHYARIGKDKDYLKEVITKEFGYDVSMTLEDIRTEGFPFDETCQATVPPAFVCVYESDSFTDTVRNSISLGGDADTMAAIAGSIAEAIYGVPSQIWISSKLLLEKYFPESDSIVEDFESGYLS